MLTTTTEGITSQARERVTTYTSALIIGVATLVLLTVVPFLPAGYILPVLLGVGLAVIYLKEPDISLIILYVLLYFSIIWQLLGFGFFQLLATPVGVIIILALVIPLLSFYSLRMEGISIALVILAVSLMLTHFYYLSIPLLLVVPLFGGFGRPRVQSINFVLLMTPLVMVNNALFYTMTPGAGSSAPIIFSQLSNLADNIRPPLSGINLLAGGVPGDYVSAHALGVTEFMLSRSYILGVPLIFFAVVLLATVSIADFISKSLLRQVSVIEVVQNYSKILAPVATTIITIAVFLVMMIGLSPLGVNVLRTAIVGHADPYILIVASFGLAIVMSGREMFTERLERDQLSKRRLEDLLTKLSDRFGVIGGELKEIAAKAPSIDVSSEGKTLAEHTSYASDVRTQLSTASYNSILSWTSDIQNRVFPSLDAMPRSLMTRLTSGLRVLQSASLTTNSHLDESKATGQRYPSMEQLVDSPQAELDQVLEIYQRAITSIDDTTTRLFDLYVETIKAYSGLMLVEEVTPPVSPAPLLASRDYVAAMKLVAEDYWLNFYVRENERYQEKLKSFLDSLSKLADASSGEDERRLARLIRDSTDTYPSSGTLMLENLNEVIVSLQDTIGRAIEEIETVKKMVATVDPSFSNVLKLNTTGILYDMLAIQGSMRKVKPNFYDVIALSKEALPIIKSLSEYRKMDAESLMVISQYPVAVRMLNSLFAENAEVVRILDLPFQRDIAAFFVRSFAASNRSYSYDEERGELTYEHDKMFQRS